MPPEDPAFDEALRAHSAGDSIGFMLLHATLAWQREVTAALADMDLTYTQFALLSTTWWLSREGTEPPTQRHVADHSGTGEVMASQVLRTLERKGLVTRERSTHDVRARAVRLTEAGLALAERAVVAVDAAERTFFAPVPDQKAMVRTLRTLGRRGPDGGAS